MSATQTCCKVSFTNLHRLTLVQHPHNQRPADSLVKQPLHTSPCNAPEQPLPLSLHSEGNSYKPAMQESYQAFPDSSNNSLSLCCSAEANNTMNPIQVTENASAEMFHKSFSVKSEAPVPQRIISVCRFNFTI